MPQPTVYPTSTQTPRPPMDARAFYSPIPRPVWTLSQAGQLTGRDAQLLGLLLDYKGKNSPIVGPSQTTLARRLACSVDTIQRSMARLEAAQLVQRVPQRSKDGRRRGVTYDLSGTLQMLPQHAAKMRPGDQQQQRPANQSTPGEKLPNLPNPTTPQKCGLEADSGNVVEATPAQATPTDPETTAVVAALHDAGLLPNSAKALVRDYGPDRCQRALFYSAQGKKKGNRAGWIIASVKTPAWHLPPLPKSAQASNTNNSSPPRYIAQGDDETPAPDVLDTLPENQYAALAAVAKTQLIAESRPPVPDLIRRGGCAPLVRERMRQLLSRPDGGTFAP